MRYAFRGGACMDCGAFSDLLAVMSCRWVDASAGWAIYTRSRCVDRARCRARVLKREQRGRVRRTVLMLAEPKAPNAPLGTCRWCGEALLPKSGTRRYCYPEREGRDCRQQEYRSRAFDARQVIRFRGDPCCVDCGSEGEWEADHDLALEDGGEHSLENIVRRCVPCHRRKTARENAARAAARAPRVSSGQLTLGD